MYNHRSKGLLNFLGIPATGHVYDFSLPDSFVYTCYSIVHTCHLRIFDYISWHVNSEYDIFAAIFLVGILLVRPLWLWGLRLCMCTRLRELLNISEDGLKNPQKYRSHKPSGSHAPTLLPASLVSVSDHCPPSHSSWSRCSQCVPRYWHPVQRWGGRGGLVWKVERWLPCILQFQWSVFPWERSVHSHWGNQEEKSCALTTSALGGDIHEVEGEGEEREKRRKGEKEERRERDMCQWMFSHFYF